MSLRAAASPHAPPRAGLRRALQSAGEDAPPAEVADPDPIGRNAACESAPLALAAPRGPALRNDASAVVAHHDPTFRSAACANAPRPLRAPTSRNVACQYAPRAAVEPRGPICRTEACANALHPLRAATSRTAACRHAPRARAAYRDPICRTVGCGSAPRSARRDPASRSAACRNAASRRAPLAHATPARDVRPPASGRACPSARPPAARLCLRAAARGAGRQSACRPPAGEVHSPVSRLGAFFC